MRCLALLAIVPLAAHVAHAKPVKESSPDHAYHFQAPETVSGDITAASPLAWSRQAELKLRVQFTNASTDWLLVRKDGVTITMPTGDFTPAKKDAYVRVQPQSDGAHTFKIADEGNGLHHVGMVAQITGAFAASSSGRAHVAPDIVLPLSKSAFTTGPFKCTNKGKVTQETQKTSVKFQCTYLGKSGFIGLVSSDRVTVGIPDGKQFGNEASKKEALLFPGDKTDIVVEVTTIKPRPHGVDMQFTDLTIKWNTTFREAQLTQVPFEPWAFELDATKTAAAND